MNIDKLSITKTQLEKYILPRYIKQFFSNNYYTCNIGNGYHIYPLHLVKETVIEHNIPIRIIEGKEYEPSIVDYLDNDEVREQKRKTAEYKEMKKTLPNKEGVHELKKI